jgi:hypothetical protein
MTPHFKLSEFTKSQTALRHGIDNTPSEEVRGNLKKLAENVLEPVRVHFGKPVRISSGYRSPALNRILGSKITSQHLSGHAADFEVPGISNLEVAKYIRDNLEFDQVIWEYGSIDDPSAGWVHCSYVAGSNRMSVLTIGIDGAKEGL